MRKLPGRGANAAYLVYRWVSQIFDPIKLYRGFLGYLRYFVQWRKYSRMEGAEPLRLRDSYPWVAEDAVAGRIDSHYFYQDIWAFELIRKNPSPVHVDVGSRLEFVGYVSTLTKTICVDIRPITIYLANWISLVGDLLSLPLKTGSIASLSCLHVAEHVGLGRYGDQLDPHGTQKAARELSRVLQPGGNLFFSLPVGKPRVCFNAHRIHSPAMVLEYFADLELVELSGIDDDGHFVPDIPEGRLAGGDYACGLFWFRKLTNG